MARKIRAVAAWLGAVALAGGAAFPAAAANIYAFSGNFSPIGDASNIQWTSGFNGQVTSTGVVGTPNVLVDFTDNQGAAFADLPATLLVDSFYTTRRGQTYPDFYAKFSLLLAAPLTFNGQTYAAGQNLLSLGCQVTLAGGSCNTFSVEFGTSVLHPHHQPYQLHANFWITPPPSEEYVSYIPGTYPYTLAGAGQMSAEFRAGGVPEPETWALMILGFGLAGVALRRRSSSWLPTI